jgi:hypothetical protein
VKSAKTTLDAAAPRRRARAGGGELRHLLVGRQVVERAELFLQRLLRLRAVVAGPRGLEQRETQQAVAVSGREHQRGGGVFVSPPTHARLNRLAGFIRFG